MTDATQHPSPIATPPAAPPPPPTLDQLSCLEDTIEYHIGDAGRKQFLQPAVLSLAWFFDAQQSFITIFADAQPKWSCDNNLFSSCNTTNICQLPKGSWYWDSPASTSTISEWSLECSGPMIAGLPSSSFFLGCVVGGLVLATLADSCLGRKRMLVVCCLIMSLAGVLTVISTNIWIYAGLRFISGFGRSPILTCALVHSSELVGKKWRDRVGNMGFMLYTLGFLSLPVIAFLLKVYDSPRWLYVKGRKEEFIETLSRMAPPEKRSNLTRKLLENCLEKIDVSYSKSQHIYLAFKLLVQRRWALRRQAALMVVAAASGMVYYGMLFGIGSLSSDLYLGVAFNALSEMPGTFVAFFVIQKLKRKRSLMGLALLSGVCSVCSVFVEPKGEKMGLVLLSFSSNIMAYNVMLIYALELFPTCVRNSAVSLVRQTALVGGIVGPVAAAAGRTNRMVFYLVSGATIGMCGFVVAWLPETRGKALCDTLEEEEHKLDV